MIWTLVLWSMLAAACLTLAAIHLPIWLENRVAWPSLIFSVLCMGTAALVLCELMMMHARTPEEYATTLRWMHVPLWVVVVSLVAQVYVYLDSGRAWLAWTVIGLRTFSLLPNFLSGVGLNFIEIRELLHVDFIGDRVSVPVGTPNPWMVLGQLSLVLCIIFVADATVTAWRRGSRGKALRIGISMVFFLVASAVQSALIVMGWLQAPVMNGLMFLAIIAAMAYELSRDLLRGQQLAIQLGESEDRMLMAAHAAKLGLWTRDVERDLSWASSQWRELIGFARDETVTMERMIEKVHPDDRDRLRQTFVDIAAGPGVRQVEFRVLRPDGSVRWITSQGQAEFDRQGHPLRTRGVSIDCTERKNAEEEMVLLRDAITHVGRVSVVGQLASALAHEINQPLGAILRNAEAAAMLLQEEFPDHEEIRAIVEDIRKDDQRAGAVIDRMRNLLRRHQVEKRPLEVNELLADVAAMLRPEALARRVKLVVRVQGEVPRVAGDRVHLQQVLLNLVSNGMDAIDGPGRDVRNGRSIVVSARHADAQAVEIEVSDTGGGIAAEELTQVFEPFFTTKPKGMGMGLAISRTIVEAHGGKLWAENQDAGARFLFTVPTA